MKTPKEIEQLAIKLYPISPNPNQMIEGFERVAYKKGYTQCQEDMANEIQSLIDGYNSDILLLEKEFREGSSVLTLEKIVTLQGVITDLEKII